jgi:hypothetical protein
VLPANLAALDMASAYRCVLAWWVAQRLPAPPQRGPRQITPYDRVVRVLRLSSQDAEALGFTGVDLLTHGWRHLITCLRASHDAARPRIRHPARQPGFTRQRHEFRARRPGSPVLASLARTWSALGCCMSWNMASACCQACRAWGSSPAA